jgi:hypothetical protein
MRRLLLASALLLLTAVGPTLARADNDRVSFGSNITVAEDESAGDIACAFCTVRVHGSVKGDLACAFCSVSVDDNQAISGDVAMLGGDLDLRKEAEVGGDVNIVAGQTNLASGASIHGSRKVLPGRLWLLLPFSPLLILGGIIWLIVYLVQRNRYRYPVYPNRRGL